MIELKELRTRVYNRFLDFRNIERAVALHSFELSWKNSTDAVKGHIVAAINANNWELLKSLIRDNTPKEEAFKDIRQRAADLRIKNYSRLSREELIHAIKIKESKNGSH